MYKKNNILPLEVDIRNIYFLLISSIGEMSGKIGYQGQQKECPVDQDLHFNISDDVCSVSIYIFYLKEKSLLKCFFLGVR